MNEKSRQTWFFPRIGGRVSLILEENADVLTRIAEALLEREVLDAEQIIALAEGRSLPEPRTAAPESAPRPSVETIEDAADEDAKDPGVLPQPGDQPA